MTITKIPVRTVYNQSNDPIGLAEFQVGEVVPISSGGTSADTVGNAKINLSLTDSNIRNLFSVAGSGSYNNSTGVITVTGGVVSVGGFSGNISNANVLAAVTNTGYLTTANIAEVDNLYFTQTRARLSVSAEGSINYDNSTGVFSFTQGNTDTITEGVTNLYYTNSRVESFVSQNITTNDIAENNNGNNLYYNNARVDAYVNQSIDTDDITEATNLYYTNARVIAALEKSEVTVDTLTVTNDLSVLGNSVVLNTVTLTVEDKNILLANGSPDAASSNGAGLTIDGADALIVYTSDEDRWETNKPLKVFGSIEATGTITSPFSAPIEKFTLNSLSLSSDNTIFSFNATEYQSADIIFYVKIGSNVRTIKNTVVTNGVDLTYSNLITSLGFLEFEYFYEIESGLVKLKSIAQQYAIDYFNENFTFVNTANISGIAILV